MSILDRFRSSKSSAETDVTLAEVLRTHDLVEVVPNGGDPFVIVSQRDPGTVAFRDESGIQFSMGQNVNQLPLDVATMELGTTSPSPFTGFMRNEYNAELRGINGLKKYDMMRRGDGTVRGTLRLVKTPVLAGRWYVEPASDSVRDKNVADFVWKCFTEYMTSSWTQVLTEALLMCDFGYYMFEKVWDNRIIDGQMRTVWQKLAPRHPMDVQEWVYDAHGGPAGVVMYDPDTLRNPNGIFIPISKLLVFSFDKEGGNMEGISVLRSAYKHWFYKDQLYKIDAIQKERHGIGIPVIKLPPGFTPSDRAIADNLGRNLRTNERAHVVLPPMWELNFAKLEGQPVDALKSIDHHDKEIEKNVLASFLDGGAKDEDQVMFLKATRFIADVVVDTFNSFAIPQLIDYNYSRVGVPKLKVRRIGEQADWRTLSFAIRNLIGAGVIIPDDDLEKHIRDEMDLPPADPSTKRIVKTPQNPNGQQGQQGNAPDAAQGNQNGSQAGQPRQSATPPVGTPSANAGTDKSGGK